MRKLKSEVEMQTLVDDVVYKSSTKANTFKMSYS
jgi:hypothetical protein